MGNNRKVYEGQKLYVDYIELGLVLETVCLVRLLASRTTNHSYNREHHNTNCLKLQ